MTAPSGGAVIQSLYAFPYPVQQNNGGRPEGGAHKAVLRQRGPTPVRLEFLLPWLHSYPDADKACQLEWGFREGFRVGYQGPRYRRWADNLRSAKEQPQVVHDKVAKEVALGRIAGPFFEWPGENLMISPLGVVPKKAPGEFRLIHHLSWPEGTSVNDFIAHEDSKVVYASVDDAVRLVLKCGHRAEMAKCDIQSAFRLLPIHPADFDLLGMQPDGAIYVDRVLPMGCAISCALFESFSTFLQWVFVKISGHRTVTHYLDDFLFVGTATSGACARALADFQRLTQQAGGPLAPEKTEGPLALMTFLGIELDANTLVARLPATKVAEMLEFLAMKMNRSQLEGPTGITGQLRLAKREPVLRGARLGPSERDVRCAVLLNSERGMSRPMRDTSAMVGVAEIFTASLAIYSNKPDRRMIENTI
ncbi:hypothetical protein NDU88_005640 [Pleurodeles waltl]|uniref:ribonuclease H n=1 Tax=Pleurodeles waltl TaxID=8319 RepID=A0AAV7L335_PLEWA|nr:hypothetical protein NDU88_005640 [Pleurodeles waltl]